MRLLVYGLLLSLLLSVAVFSQSGRRIKRKAAPTPKPTKVVDKNVYSESRPFRPVRLIPGRKKKKKREAKVVEAKSDAENDGEDDIISVESSLVNIPVSVFDKNGIYVPYIRQDEFKIFENGVEQQIEYFGTNDQPFTVALVIDTSGSTSFKIEDIHFAAKAFVRLLEPRDRVMVISFSSNVRVRAKPTNDKAVLDRAIERTRFGGGTAIYNAVGYTLNRQMKKFSGRKAIVLFTDGVDTSHLRGGMTRNPIYRNRGYEDNYEDAEESDTLIYPVFYNTFLSSITGGTVMSSPIPSMGGIQDAQAQTFGKAYLEQLAALTGGRLFEAGRSRALLLQAFQGIARELRTQYNLGYSPSEVGERGERRRIKVRVYRPDLRVRARDSYIVGEQKSGN